MDGKRTILAVAVVVLILAVSFLAFQYGFAKTSGASPAVDASAGGYCASSVTCSASAITTVKASELVLAFYSINFNGTQPTSVSCTDSSGLTFAQRFSGTDPGSNTNHLISLFYASTSSILTSDAISCSYSGTAAPNLLTIVTVSGYDHSVPFDPSSSLPSDTLSSTHATTGATSVSTKNPNDLVLGFFKVDGPAQTYTPGTGFTSVIAENGSPTEFIEADSVSSTHSSLSVSATWTVSHDWFALGDAIEGNPASSVSTTTSQGQTNTTSVTSTSTSAVLGQNTTNIITQIETNPVTAIEYTLVVVIIGLAVAVSVLAVRKR